MAYVPTGLIDRVAELDEAGCSELLGRCEGLVRAAIRQGGYFVPEMDEEGLRAELRFQILLSIRSWDPRKGSFSTWVFGIGRNLLNGYLRRRRARVNVVSLDSLQDLPDTVIAEATSGSADEDSPLVLAFREWIRRMSVEERLVIEHMMTGQSRRRLAEALRISEGAAKMRVHRLRRRLRKELADKVG